MSSRSRIGSGAVSGVAGTVSLARSRSESQPSGRRSESTSSAWGTSAPSSFALTSPVAWPTWASGRLPEVDVADAHQRQPLQRPVGADEVLDEVVGGAISSSAGVAYWASSPPFFMHRDPVAHLDRLVDVVGDEQDGLADLGLEAEELVLEALAVDRVDRAEGLVHQHHRRVRRERPGDADALLLAARELGRVAVAHLGVQADQVEQLVDPRLARSLSQPTRPGTVAMFSPMVRWGKSPICWIT